VTLVPGSRLGPYEVVSAIGAGGMGEVHRARDTTDVQASSLSSMSASLERTIRAATPR
jgi:serine/threonine protein kinase